MSPAQIRDLVAWRNRANPAGFPVYDNYVHNWAEMQGFLTPFSAPAGATSATDGYIFGRQDLIRYWLHENGATSYSDLITNHPTSAWSSPS